MLNKNIFLIICIVLLVCTINADTDTQTIDDTYQINKIINYAKPCVNNGTYCSTNARCNFTIFKPDNSLLLNNQQATNKIAYHNHSVYLEQAGVYKVDMVCVDNGLTGSETYYFQVTGSGINDNRFIYIIIFGFAIFFIVLGFWIKDGWVVMFGSFSLVLLGIYILLNGIDLIRDINTTRGISMIVIGVGSYISIRSAMEMFDQEL